MILREGKERPKQKQKRTTTTTTTTTTKRKEKKKKRKEKENHGQTTSDKVREKTIIESINLYDAWIKWKNDTFSNALRTVQLYFKKKELTWI